MSLTSREAVLGGEAVDELGTLVERAKAGDRDAFDALLRRFESKALVIARQMGLGPEDAQDAAQDAFLKLFRYIRRFRTGESFTNWFYRIVVHATYDHLRRQVRRHPVGLDGPAQERAEEIADGSAASGDRAEARQAQQRILAVIHCLAPRERAAFVLRDVQGLDTGLVARAMRVSRVTVRRHAQNARRRIRARLEGQYPEMFRRDDG